jgi:hypothetical protein
VPSGQCLAAVGEYSRATRVFPLADPGIASNGQCVRRVFSLAIEKLASELTTRWIEANNFEPAHADPANTSVRRVHRPRWLRKEGQLLVCLKNYFADDRTTWQRFDAFIDILVYVKLRRPRGTGNSVWER